MIKIIIIIAVNTSFCKKVTEYYFLARILEAGRFFYDTVKQEDYSN